MPHASLLRRGSHALAATLLLTGIAAQAHAQQQPQAPPPAVGVRLAEIRGVARSYEFVGRIAATNTVQLRARVEGFLDKILFTEGQEVKTGQLLYQLEKSVYQAQVDQAKANLAAAQATAWNADIQYRRSYELAQHQNAPQSTVDQNKAAMDSAKASVLQNEAALQLAQINLGYTDIWAPVDGRIGRTVYTKGNLVNPGSGALDTIVSQDPMYAVFPVSLRQLQEIRQSRQQEDGRQIKIEILVRLANGKDYQHPGVWNFTDPQVSQQTDTILMRGTMPNPERLLVDGEFVTVVVRERHDRPRLTIPLSALQLDQAGTYVLVVNSENKVETRRVKLGPKEDTDIVIDDGLKEGERVIVDGIQKVHPGQQVTATVLPTAAKGPGG